MLMGFWDSCIKAMNPIFGSIFKGVENSEKAPFISDLKKYFALGLITSLLQFMVVGLSGLTANSEGSAFFIMVFSLGVLLFLIGIITFYYYLSFLTEINQRNGGTITRFRVFLQSLWYGIVSFFLTLITFGLAAPIVYGLGTVGLSLYIANFETDRPLTIIDSYKEAWSRLKEHGYLVNYLVLFLVSLALQAFVNWGNGGLIVGLLSFLVGLGVAYGTYVILGNIDLVRTGASSEIGTGLSAG